MSAFLSNLAGSVLGILGTVGFVMNLFEENYENYQNSRKEKKKLDYIVQNNSQLNHLNFINMNDDYFQPRGDLLETRNRTQIQNNGLDYTVIDDEINKCQILGESVNIDLNMFCKRTQIKPVGK